MATKKWFGHHQTTIPLVIKTNFVTNNRPISVGFSHKLDSQSKGLRLATLKLVIENFQSPSYLRNGD
jgi:hypothetical protein